MRDRSATHSKCRKNQHAAYPADPQYNEALKKLQDEIADLQEDGRDASGTTRTLEDLKGVKNDETGHVDDAERMYELLNSMIVDHAYLSYEPETVYLGISYNDRYDMHSALSQSLSTLLTKAFALKYGNPANKRHVAQAIETARAVRAGRGRAMPRAYRRVAQTDCRMLVDMNNEKRTIYAITPDAVGPSMQYSPEMGVAFEHHGAEIPLPEKRDGSWLDEFCKLTRISPDMVLLFKLHVCHMFCMAHETPFMMICGPEESGKTTTAMLVKRLVDPGEEDGAMTLDKDVNKMAMMFSKEQTRVIDNIGYIRHDTSDLLCRACTGGTFERREYYHTDMVRKIPFHKMRLILTAISREVVRKPDLLSRMLIYDVGKAERGLDKKEIDARFEKMQPYLLYEVFGILGRAMGIHRAGGKRHARTRMANFETFGASILEAMGVEADPVMRQYREAMRSQRDALSDGDPVLTVLAEMLKDGEPIFELAETLFKRVEEKADDMNMSIVARDFPATVRQFRARLDEMAGVMRERGYHVKTYTDCTNKAIKRRRLHVRIVKT